MIREVLRMGDSRLLERSREVERFDTPAIDALIADMRDTMKEYDGAGLASPQIGASSSSASSAIRAIPTPSRFLLRSF